MRWKTLGICSTGAFLAFAPMGQASESKPSEDLPIVSAHTIAAEEIFDVYTYPARVLPKVNATLLSDSDGVVSKVYAPIGARVKRGQRLIQISHTDPVYQYAPSYVIAPVAGVVSSLNVREGTQVQKNQDVVAVTDPSQVRINVEIAATDLDAIHSGITGDFKFSGLDSDVKVKVIGVSPFVNPATGSATCELEIVDAKKILTPGLVGQVVFKANSRNGFLVPDHALYYKDGGTFLRVIDKDQVSHRVAVVLGRKQRGQVEILKGVQPGDQIVERTSKFVGEGQKVQVQSEAKKQG